MQTNIYPAIDIIDGQCVRLTQGDFDTKIIYNDDPVQMAHNFKSKGAEFIHIVDLDAAQNPAINNRKLISEIITTTGLKVQTGGGIRSEADVVELLNLGAHRLIIGSTAVNNRQEVFKWINAYGANKIVIGADVAQRKISTHGWLNVTDEDVFDFINMYLSNGGTTFLCTDIAKDGMMSGASRSLYHEIKDTFADIKLIASGGVHDIEEVNLLTAMEMESIIIGKALYEGKIDIELLFAKP